MNENKKVAQLNWAGGIIGPGEGYGGRPEHIRVPEEHPTLVTESDLAAIFENGSLPRPEATKLLQAFTGASRATCYRALDVKGRLANRLRDEKGMPAWRE